MQYWFLTTNAADAPILQLKLYRDLVALRCHYPKLVDAAIRRLQNHLYFVCEEMTPLALASPLLDDAERQALAQVQRNDTDFCWDSFSYPSEH